MLPTLLKLRKIQNCKKNEYCRKIVDLFSGFSFINISGLKFAF